MAFLGINLFGWFVILIALVAAAFLGNLLWLENYQKTTKMVLSCGLMVLWFGVFAGVYTVSNMKADPFSCSRVDYVLNVEGKVVFLSSQNGFAKICQDSTTGRVFLSGPNGEFK